MSSLFTNELIMGAKNGKHSSEIPDISFSKSTKNKNIKETIDFGDSLYSNNGSIQGPEYSFRVIP